MAELVDALDLGSSAFGRGGSTPSTRTKKDFQVRVLFLCVQIKKATQQIE